ncbi:hypothetical protein IQ273_07625 [Nodosilinea sp. LEGE 07298]|uniref:hypothetical protein n=1 Tax=Nodosilinea sp. LEGE 07298 TaxID=2777970 RepID=UPI0018823B62|nr:hypothetical protein [Nodosilinea sp. LEGE 07298]MBE9109283.1 hypothetical protein [Nodosilinea sp. LEGE 07298]
MTHDQGLEDLLASPVFLQGLSPQEAEIFQAMCGELSGLATQIAGSITAQSSSGAPVDLMMLFQNISAAVEDETEKASLWEQFEEQIQGAQVTLTEIGQCPVSLEELERAKHQVGKLLQLIDQMGQPDTGGAEENQHSFWNRLSGRIKAVLFYKLF